jgi:galactose mutarotase-like enzyme
MTAIVPHTWFGLAALAIESEALRVIVVPEMGAKIVSLFDKYTQREWLVGPMRPLVNVSYGAQFVDQDMSGWDEVFPTIDSCKYPIKGEYYGRVMPDHGEVWTLAWQREKSAVDKLTLSVQGIALPYYLIRTISFSTPSVLRIDYRVTNFGAERLAYLWAAHPQFAADSETEIIFPPEVEEVHNVMSGDKWGEAGMRYAWPDAITMDKNICSINQIGSATLHSCRKFYISPEIHVHWAGLADHRSGSYLRMEWLPVELPYLGIWVDEGAYNRVPVVALEPTTGFYDNLTFADQNGRARYLRPNETHQWGLSVQISNLNEQRI